MKKLVEKSIEQYLAIQEKLTEMAALIKDGKIPALVQAQQEWQQLQDDARAVDAQIADLEGDGQAAETCLAEREHRQQILRQVKQQVDALMRRVRNLQVLTGDELQRLRKGRRALGGYRSSNQGTGHANLGRC